MIYLDNAATTKPKKEVIETVNKYMEKYWFNPSSLYDGAYKVHQDIDSARKVVADSICAKKNEVFFTSGGSESNCWAIQGFIKYCERSKYNPIIVFSDIEHKSILECVRNSRILYNPLKVNSDGYIQLGYLDEYLKWITQVPENKVLVSVHYANNEIGTIQYVGRIATICHKYNAIFHTDAVQAYGSENCDVQVLGADMLSASGHKIGATKGVGFLYIKEEIQDMIEPIIYGTQMDGKRGGTENVPAIMGMAKAINLLTDNWYEKRLSTTKKRKYFIHKLWKTTHCRINGDLEHRLANNISATFLDENLVGENLVYQMDMAGIEIATGSACNSKTFEPSYVLKAIGMPDEEIMRTIRITISDNTTYGDIDKFIEALKKAIMLSKIPDDIEEK